MIESDRFDSVRELTEVGMKKGRSVQFKFLKRKSFKDLKTTNKQLNYIIYNSYLIGYILV